MVCAHVGNVSREGQPGGLCMVQTAVLGQGVAEEKSQAAWKGSELAKRFCGVFCMPLPFLFSLGTFFFPSLSQEAGLASHSGGGGG